MNKLFWKDGQVVSYNPLQIMQGLAKGLVELTEEEIEELNKPAPKTEEDFRSERDHLLTQTDWLIQRHQEEELLGKKTTLTKAKYTALLNYRQELRDLPDHPDFPDTPLPECPVDL